MSAIESGVILLGLGLDGPRGRGFLEAFLSDRVLFRRLPLVGRLAVRRLLARSAWETAPRGPSLAAALESHLGNRWRARFAAAADPSAWPSAVEGVGSCRRLWAVPLFPFRSDPRSRWWSRELRREDLARSAPRLLSGWSEHPAFAAAWHDVLRSALDAVPADRRAAVPLLFRAGCFGAERETGNLLAEVRAATRAVLCRLPAPHSHQLGWEGWLEPPAAELPRWERALELARESAAGPPLVASLQWRGDGPDGEDGAGSAVPAGRGLTLGSRLPEVLAAVVRNATSPEEASPAKGRLNVRS
jgi:hypothetical protein